MNALIILLYVIQAKYVYDSSSLPALHYTKQVLAIRFCTTKSLICERTEEDYEEAARISKTYNYSFVNVDCTESLILCSQYSIASYPTILVYINRIKHHYMWSYDPESIVNGISKLRYPMLQVLYQYNPNTLCDNEPDKFVIITNDSSKVACIENASKSIAFARFIISKKPFYYNGILLKEESVVFISSTYSEQSHLSITYDNIYEFALLQMSRKQIIFNWNAKDMVYRYHYTLVVLFYDYNDIDSKQYITAFRKFAIQNKQLAYSEATRKLEAADFIMNEIHLENADLPQVVILKMGSQLESYRMNKSISIQSLTEFVNSFPNISQPEPIPTIKEVGNTFIDDVLNSEMDVMVKYYAPTKDCPLFDILFEKLCSALPPHSKIKCVEVNLKENQMYGMNFTGLPSFFYYKQNSSAIMYKGILSNYQKLMNFIEEVATVRFHFNKSMITNYIMRPFKHA